MREPVTPGTCTRIGHPASLGRSRAGRRRMRTAAGSREIAFRCRSRGRSFLARWFAHLTVPTAQVAGLRERSDAASSSDDSDSAWDFTLMLPRTCRQLPRSSLQCCPCDRARQCQQKVRQLVRHSPTQNVFLNRTKSLRIQLGGLG